MSTSIANTSALEYPIFLWSPDHSRDISLHTQFKFHQIPTKLSTSTSRNEYNPIEREDTTTGEAKGKPSLLGTKRRPSVIVRSGPSQPLVLSYLRIFLEPPGGRRINFKGATCVRQIRFAPRTQDVQREQRMPITGRYIPAYIRLHSAQRLENKQRARRLLVVRRARSA